ncbi:SPFH domain / Band 7 family protein [compost metagenome]
MFLNEGVVADVFQPGRYELTTQNMPIMTTIRGWKYGFNSPFKADVYFINLRQFVNQRWGTKNPIMLRDPEFGPIRLRAFGNFSFQVKDVPVFMKQLVATTPVFTVDDITEQLRNIAVSRGMDAIAESKIPALDLASNYDEVSALIQQKITGDFEEIGLSLTKFLIENISFPEEVEKALDKRSSMGVVGNLGAYAQFQAANSMEKAAENPSSGGIVGAGFGAGLGAGMVGQMGNVFQQNNFDGNNPAGVAGAGAVAAGSAGPPPLPKAVAYYLAIKGKQEGPFDQEQLRGLVGEGTFTTSTLVWKEGLDNWTEADKVVELKDLFSQTPPPIPGV